MKVILTGIVALIAYLGSVVSCIWAIVEFILYLVKDKVFNWWSVWSILICGGVALTLFMLSVIFTARARNESIKNSEKRKSRFQQRLEEIEKQRRRAR